MFIERTPTWLWKLIRDAKFTLQFPSEFPEINFVDVAEAIFLISSISGTVLMSTSLRHPGQLE